jgi:hypothetical protein
MEGDDSNKDYLSSLIIDESNSQNKNCSDQDIT